MSTGEGAQVAPSSLAEPAGDEALHRALVVRDAKGCISSFNQRPHAVDDDLQDTFEGEFLRDRDGRDVEGLQSPACIKSGCGPSLGFADGSRGLLGVGGCGLSVRGSGGVFHPSQSTSPDMTNGPSRVS